MKKDLKEEWIRRLESGDYEQGYYQLHYKDSETGNDRYCCLGVLSEICAEKGICDKVYDKDGDMNMYTFKNVTCRDDLSAVVENVGLPIEVHGTLIYANDEDRKSFDDIALIIEEKVPEE